VGTEKRERQKANRANKQHQIQQEASRRKTFRLIAIGVGAVAAVFLFAWIASNFVGDDSPAPAPVDSVVTTPATGSEG
jgi:ferric-dicitrate binding protein FerR (iron transport regulator)